RVETKVVARLHHLLAAEPAAEAAGAARVRPQRVALDQQRIFGLDLLGGTVVGIAVVHGDGRVAAVAVVLGAPAAPDQPPEIELSSFGRRPLTRPTTRSAWWPAMMCSGIAGASALKMVSMTVMG